MPGHGEETNCKAVINKNILKWTEKKKMLNKEDPLKMFLCLTYYTRIRRNGVHFQFVIIKDYKQIFACDLTIW